MVERKMTPNGFVSKLTSAKSALGFLAAHREYMTTGEIAPIVSPILAKVDSGALMPTPALQEIKDAVWASIQAAAVAKAEGSLIKSESEGGIEKPYLASIRDELGRLQYRTKDDGEEVPLEKGFDMPQDADRWIDRMLVASSPDCHGERFWANAPGEDQRLVMTHRDDAMYRTYRPGRSADCKGGAKSAGKLSWGVKCEQTRSYFSKG